jgi:hypothetical protein
MAKTTRFYKCRNNAVYFIECMIAETEDEKVKAELKQLAAKVFSVHPKSKKKKPIAE